MADIGVGRVVFSKCGRDKGLPFVVVKADGEYLYLCDGKYRPLTSPKKKKLKHVQYTNYFCEDIAAAVCGGTYLLDSDVRKAIGRFVKIDVNDYDKESDI